VVGATGSRRCRARWPAPTPGEVRHVDPGHHADLFWAVGGGKGDFGIVTDIEFDLVPVARFHGGAVFFPPASTADVLHAWREWAPNLPEDTTTSVALLRLPPDPALPEPVRGQFVVSLRFTHLGTAEEGAALLAPMRAVATPLMDRVGRIFAEDDRARLLEIRDRHDPAGTFATNIVIG
jgi:FAD/FMN-containing dehydrogenase